MQNPESFRKGSKMRRTAVIPAAEIEKRAEKNRAIPPRPSTSRSPAALPRTRLKQEGPFTNPTRVHNSFHVLKTNTLPGLDPSWLRWTDGAWDRTTSCSPGMKWVGELG